MARPAGFAKQYSLATFTAWALALASGRAGIVTGTTACSPFCAVSCNWVWQAVGLSDTATCDGATKPTWSVPHSTWGGPARSGSDVYTSHRPELAPDATTRSGRGVLMVSVLVSDCDPVSWTSRRVRPPADTGTRTVPPAADQRPVCPSPFSDTASRLWARICWPAVPACGVTRIVTVFEAGEKTHATCR